MKRASSLPAAKAVLAGNCREAIDQVPVRPVSHCDADCCAGIASAITKIIFMRQANFIILIAMKRLLSTGLILLSLATANSGQLAAQSAHSRLTDTTLLKRFDNLSRKLMCTCGCNMPLRNCNHTGHCNAWPQRDALDKLLLAGYSDQQILDGFRNGFGKTAESADYFAMARTPDYAYMVSQFRDGFGSQILSIPESNYLGVFSALGFILCLGVVMLFIRRRRNDKPALATQLLDEKHREELLRRIAAEEN
jgi:cytochrome c-type biogenesis protein CcmH/NrfF